MMFLLDELGDVLQCGLTGEMTEEGEDGEEQEDLDSCHHHPPSWLQQSAGTELTTIGSEAGHNRHRRPRVASKVKESTWW